MSQSIVRVVNLSHRYNIQWAIRELNFEIPERGIYGMLGSNGAGKSTTMNILCGVLKQTDGVVYINGIDTRKDPIGVKENIGFLPQQPPLYKDLTVEEYLDFCAHLHKMYGKRMHAAVEEVMEHCGISHFRRRLIKNLSGGYQQRVGVAQAVIHKPALVVLDEPSNGLDPNQMKDIRQLIKNIAQERTVILSTHILSEVQVSCDHVMMIEQGRLVFMGSVDEFDNYVVPNTLFVSFRQSPLKGQLEQIEGVAGVEELDAGSFRIRYTEVQKVTDQLIYESVKNGWHIAEIRVEKSSLDNIFAEMSGKARK